MSDNNQTPQSDEELGPPKADFGAPPPYELTNSLPTIVVATGNQMQHHQAAILNSQTQNLHHQQLQQMHQQNMIQQSANNEQQQQQHLQHGTPQIHGKLPTYEEVQLEKSLNGELPPAFLTLQPPPPLPPPNPLIANLRGENGNTIGGGGGVNSSANGNGTSPALTFIAIDTSDAENLTNSDSSLLGTDIMFITAFMVAFLFNWIGFLVLTCFCHTIAARYGALSGFGLSLAKWTLIVKNSTELASHENSWLWWLIMAFGFLICVRALIQYVSIKRTWRLLSTSAQERLLFLY